MNCCHAPTKIIEILSRFGTLCPMPKHHASPSKVKQLGTIFHPAKEAPAAVPQLQHRKRAAWACPLEAASCAMRWRLTPCALEMFEGLDRMPWMEHLRGKLFGKVCCTNHICFDYLPPIQDTIGKCSSTSSQAT